MENATKTLYKQKLPTIIPPKEYKERFLETVTKKYFIEIVSEIENKEFHSTYATH